MEANEAFSRLDALSKLNVVKDYSRVRSKTVVIVGVGGVGSVAAEMLVRCGVKKLILFDYDRVELANMNRMFFTPAQVGLSKVDAAVETLQRICQGSVEIRGFNCNVCSIDGYHQLKSQLVNSRQDPTHGSETLLLCCVDNYAARITVNRLCLDLQQIWLESGVAETAMSGHVQCMFPGVSACFECAPPCVVAEAGDEKIIVRPGVCAASLPTTMSIVAGMLVQTALKLLLAFGKVNGFVGYDGLSDYMPVYEIRPNPDCVNEACKILQSVHSKPEEVVCPRVPEPDITSTKPSNAWGIEVQDSGCIPNVTGGTITGTSDHQDASLGDLMERLKRR